MNKDKICIYQVLPRLYGNNQRKKKIKHGDINQNGCGKFNDFTDKRLQILRKFGFTHIWYTGILEHATQTDYSKYGILKDSSIIVKGKAGSPYAVKDYFDVDPDLAINVNNRLKEFDALIKRTKDADLKCIIDFVPNHVAREYHSDKKPSNFTDLGEGDNTELAFDSNNNFYYIPHEELHLNNIVTEGAYDYYEFPAKVTGNNHFDAWPSKYDWFETVKLNYGIDFQNLNKCHFCPIPSTWKKMTNILLYWAEKGIDGFRCDMAEMVPVEFWSYAIRHVKDKFPDIIFIAEVYNPQEYRNYIYKGGFDYLYDKVGLYDTLRDIICERKDAAAITGCWQSIDDIKDYMLNFLENHDEQRIASAYFAADPYKALPAFVVSSCMGCNPIMIYAGQEIGEPGMDEEGYSGKDGRTSIFDYWRVESLTKLLNIKLTTLSDSEKYLYNYYQNVLQTVNGLNALKYGSFFDLMYANCSHPEKFDTRNTYAFLRSYQNQHILVLVNFSSQNKTVEIKIPREAMEYMQLKEGRFKGYDHINHQKRHVEISKDCFIMMKVFTHSAVVLEWND